MLPVLLQSRGYSHAELKRLGGFLRYYFLLNNVKNDDTKGAWRILLRVESVHGPLSCH